MSTKNSNIATRANGNGKGSGKKSYKGGKRQVAVAYGGELRQQAAVMKSMGGSMLVSHREYVTDVTAANGNFLVTGFNINPGMASVFPWLNKIANNFEKYRIKKLVCKYESLVGSIQAGSVMLAIDMDAYDDNPSSKSAMLQYQNAARSNVWSTCETRIPEQPKQLYVRSGATTGDLKTYDTGKLFVATQGTGSTSVTVGEVWVEYVIELAIPQGT